jgi:D-xylose 1-dehydrogenase
MSFGTYPSLKSAVVLVTGGASGIGEEIVRAFAAQGARTGFVDLDAERGRVLAEELEQQGAEVRFEPCDLRDIDQLKRAFAALEAALGPATVLVNSLGRRTFTNRLPLTRDWQAGSESLEPRLFGRALTLPQPSVCARLSG